MNPAKTPLLAGLCLALVLAACGGGQDTSTTSNSDKADAELSAPDTLASASSSPTLSEEENTAWERSAALNRAEVQQSIDSAAQAQSSAVAPQAISATAAPIYRFLNIQTGSHFYTKSVTERDTVLNTLSHLRYEGPVFSAWQSTAAGLYPVYRFNNTRSGAHVYSISESEKNDIVANMPWIQLEGLAYYASKTAQPGTTPLYRFRHLQQGFHFYTANASEKDYIAANLKASFQLEGVAYYVNASIGTYDKALANLAGQANSTGNINGTGESARLQILRSLTVDNNGNIYAAEGRFDDGAGARTRVKRVSSTGLVQDFIGSIYTYGSTDGVGSGATFEMSRAVTYGNDGFLYVGDKTTIRRVSLTGTVTTIAGSLTSNGYANGQALNARFNYISGIAIDSKGNIFVSDNSNHCIRKLSPTGVVSTFAGASSVGNSGFSDGQGTSARFSSPAQLGVDANDNLYVADTANRRIRKITPSGMVSTLAGQSTSGTVDGDGSAATFMWPYALAVDKSTGNIYVGDNYVVRKVTSSGTVSTVVGTKGNDGVFYGSLPAGLSGVEGLATANGRLYIASNHGIYWTHLP